MPKVWFITGASRGLGRALVGAALRSGHSVTATTRAPESLGDLVALYSDRLRVSHTSPSERDRVKDAVRMTVENFGALDVVVNNAATAVFAPAEDLSEEDLRTQIEVGFFGAVSVTQAAIPIMRAQRSGRIIQISSISTRRPGAGLAGYSAAKWALTGFSYALSSELAPFNVQLTLVEPGGMRTTMATETQARTIRPAYAATAGQERQRILARSGEEPIDPDKVAQVILALVDKANPPLRLVLGADALAVARAMLERQFASDEAWASLSRAVDFAVE